ncbi:MAG TPA: LpqB family beta-propeller domain-containing protein [Mycobacteriales bacterium]|nr:LpqB family beta-propeller domain-containing protein [Mycobacteriales bacterium]
MPSHAAARAACSVLAVAALGGCASIPNDGPVTIVSAAADSRVTETVFAAPPSPGENPHDIVQGFLNASAVSGGGHPVARDYLTSFGSAAWQDSGSVRIYDQASLTISPLIAGIVTVTASLVATIDDRGDYTPAGGSMVLHLPLVQEKRQWRIAAVPAGLVVSSDFFQTFNPVDVYFLDPTGRVLVPVPIRLQVSDPDLVTATVRALLAGPTPRYAGAVTTEVPAGTALAGPVSVGGNVARVDLAGAHLGDLPRLRVFVAELVWTLGQFGITEVRVTANGTPVDVPGTLAANASFDPDVVSAPAGFAVIGGALRRLAGHSPAAVPGTAGLRDPAVSPDGRFVAGLRPGPAGATLVAGPIGTRLSAVFADPQLLPPSFDVGDALWTVATTPAGDQRIVRVAVGQQSGTVVSSGPAPLGDVSAFAISRDGARVALVAGGRVLVGPVSITVAGPVVAPANLVALSPPQDTALGALGWQDADSVATLALVPVARDRQEPAAQIEPLLVPVSGEPPTAVATPGLPADLTQIAAAPGQPMLVTAGGGVWAEQPSGWLRVASGSDPAYPGG